MKSAFLVWLQIAIREKEWSISELARRSWISQSHLSNIISGNRKASATTLAALARAFNLPAEVLFAKAGLLPPAQGASAELEKEWQHIFTQAATDKERKELIARAKFELDQIKRRR
jgi:transcriptional regulator with XRE-family HTH domain